MSDEVDTRPLWEGGVWGKYQVKVVPIGEATFRANLMIYDLNDMLLYQREVLANRNLPDGAGQPEYKQWQKIVTDWILNLS